MGRKSSCLPRLLISYARRFVRLAYFSSNRFLIESEEALYALPLYAVTSFLDHLYPDHFHI